MQILPRAAGRGIVQMVGEKNLILSSACRAVLGRMPALRAVHLWVSVESPGAAAAREMKSTSRDGRVYGSIAPISLSKLPAAITAWAAIISVPKTAHRHGQL